MIDSADTISRNNGWGIIRYAPNTGASPEDDCCGFDGWYSDRDEAAAVYAYWCKRYPNWIVALVEGTEVRFSDRALGHSRREPCPLKCQPEPATC